MGISKLIKLDSYQCVAKYAERLLESKKLLCLRANQPKMSAGNGGTMSCKCGHERHSHDFNRGRCSQCACANYREPEEETKDDLSSIAFGIGAAVAAASESTDEILSVPATEPEVPDTPSYEGGETGGGGAGGDF